jgi:hypothetical protein
VAEERPSAIALPPREARIPILPLALASGVGFFLGLQVLALEVTGGVFEYPLDDVYIHLAMAGEIARGGYGVNAGEFAAAASSILYPLLLAPFGDAGPQRYLPLLWNLAALVACCVLWGRIVLLAGLGSGPVRHFGMLFALLGPIALNWAGVGFTGMEHTLHLALALATVLGLARFLEAGRIGPFLVAGIVLAPLLRPEGLALSGLAAAVILLRGRPLAGLGLGLAAVLPVILFGLFLVAIGLDPVPGSIRAKLGLPASLDLAVWERIGIRLAANLQLLPGQVIAGLAFLLLLLVLFDRTLRQEGRRLLGLAAVMAALAHLGLAQIGWFNRYEVYILSVLAGTLLLVSRDRFRRDGGAALALALLGSQLLVGWGYVRDAAIHGPNSARAIWLQQGQMARFAQDYLQAPVAVNDLGHVAWQNRSYVLDLWGLASAEALEARFSDPPPGWAGPLAAARGVELAMIYETWLARAVPDEWVRLGTLSLTVPKGFAADADVAFFATRADLVPRIGEKLAAFAPTLPAGVEFRFEPGIRPPGSAEP